MRSLLAAAVMVVLTGQCFAQQRSWLDAFSGTTTAEELEKSLSNLARQFEAEAEAQRADRRAEATVVVSNILSAAGVRGFRMLQGEDTPIELRQRDAVWTAPGVAGSVRIVSAGTSTPKLEDLASTVMADDAKHCKGVFASGRYPTDPGGSARLMTGCGTATTKVEVHYTIAPRSKGGFYIFSVVGLDGSDKAAQEAGAKIYTVAIKILPR